MRCKIGCQSITFGTELHQTDIEKVFSDVANAGYDGIEMGFYRLDPEKSAEYQRLMKKYNLELVALHVGGNIFDPDSQAQQAKNIDAVIKLCKELGSGNVFFSGTRTGDDMPKEDFAEQAGRIAILAKQVTDAGLELCYHNHDWEIKNDLLGLRTLMDATDPTQVKLVLDVGWVRRGGANPVDVIEKYGARIRHIHFKEFTADGDFTEIGSGIVDFPGAVKAISDKSDFWIVAEQDQSRIGPAESVKINCEYIRNLIKEA